MKKRICILLSMLMVFSMTMGIPGTPVLAANDPAPIQDTYELDGVTYYNVGSSNFAVDKSKFYRDMLGTRSSLIAHPSEYDQSESDLWLQVGLMLLTDHTPDQLYQREYFIENMYNAAERGSYVLDYGEGEIYRATRYDLEGKSSPKAAEEWVFQNTFGENKDFGYFKDDSSEQLTLATAVNVKYTYPRGQIEHTFSLAAYFTNFRVFALIPSDEGSNYVTEIITDTVNSKSTTASTVKNLTASTVTGSQSVSNSVTASVSNSVNGSESYSTSKSLKVGASYKFTEAFQASGETAWTETDAFSTGWEASDSISKSKNAEYTVSIPLAPYTQAMITQSDTTSVYLTKYNCPIAILYDVTVVGYQSGDFGDGIMHNSSKDIDSVYTFADPINGARGNLDTRVNGWEQWGDTDEQGIRWGYIMEGSPWQYDLYTAPDAIKAAASHVPMSPTGAAYTQTLNVVSSEVSGLMPTHPLYRVKIAEPGVDIHTDVVSYKLFDYYTANMEVGDYSYANYMNLVGLNRNDAPFYGFSKDNGYLIITDKEGNEMDPEDSPVKLEKDPVSTNWRYTAVKPGTCYLVYRINEDAYYTADRPNDPIKNKDLVKTAALEIIVTEKDPTDTIVITGSYQGHPDTAPELLEGDSRLQVSVYDETGKEIEKSYTWEAKELKGISVTEAGEVSFTKEGTYHVRAVNGKLRSDWYEITAGHKPADAVRENVVPAKCEEGGSYDLVTYCSVCGEELGREHAEELMLLHSFDEGVVTKEPTPEEDGIMTYTCTRCGEIRTEKIHYHLNPPGGEEASFPDPVSIPVNCFKDVTEDLYCYDSVIWALTQDPQITAGTSEELFSPNGVCTRGQAVTFLWRAAGAEKVTGVANPFTDVREGSYYYDAVLWAYKNGVTSGTSATEFSPDATCSRAQIVTLLWRSQGQKPSTASIFFADVDSRAFYYDAVKWAVEKEVTEGTSITTFSPSKDCTRGEIVTFLYRAMK